ncbi:MAG: tetratricopeptide repeat protein, partial [Thermodesulfobacteriota bacterium]|nr:tetratricopeptide repeat protein [Thermodesulfobacteriota bacterium]
MVLRADLFSRMGRAETLFPAYAKVIREFSDIEEWADMAVDRILELSVSEADSAGPEEQTRLLRLVIDRYSKTLPRLAMGAWNRIGDILFDADEWTSAKNAYRQVIEQFPVITTQTTAARLALAEILFREERFRQTLDQYETEMISRPYEDYLYVLAREAYVRKSVAAGEFLYRLGEVPAARNIFSGLLRDDYTIVEAHRGYIKCAAAQKQIQDILNRYRKKLETKPNDPIILYATGLCMTYAGGRKALVDAKSLIRRAIQQQGQIEYFHQTMGYVLEVLETVHHESGRLEAALESYQKAYFLNNPKKNPENAANLSLNLGNVYFLLGQYGKAVEYFEKRFETGIPFGHEDTEILFYRRFGAAAFQAKDRNQSIGSFRKTLDLIERRIQPKRASIVMGRINRFIFDRIITPALERPESNKTVKKLAERQTDLNRSVFEVSHRPVGPPPDPSWTEYRNALESAISKQEKIVLDLGPFIYKERELKLQALSYMIVRARDAIKFPQHLMHLKAEMLDRLGLAYQEAEKWKEARETFKRAFELNERMDLFRNLAANQRSIAYNAYMEAGTRIEQERQDLLNMALEGFNRVIQLVDKYGVIKKKREQPKKAVISLALDISLDEASSSQAMYGFSAEQEKRLANAFISRIQIELGQLVPAQEALKRQLALYPPGVQVPDKDLYGLSLLYHRAGHLAFALRDRGEAFENFRRSAELSHKLENPVSTAINVANMARVLVHISTDNQKMPQYVSLFISLDRKTMQLLARSDNVLESSVIPSYHNAVGVFVLNMCGRSPVGSMEKAVRNIERLQRAGMHFSTGLRWLDKHAQKTKDRKLLSLWAVLHLNMAKFSNLLGEEIKAKAHCDRAFKIGCGGLLPEYQWRALAGLGRMKEALEILESVSILRAGCGPGEVTSTFVPLVADLMEKGTTEDTFNLVERLSELERVHRLVPLVLGTLPPDERKLLRRSYTRLLKISELRRRLVDANDSERGYLSGRLDQEREILEQSIGKKRRRLPSIVRLSLNETIQDRLIIILGLAIHAEDVADKAVKQVDGGETAPLRQTYHGLIGKHCRAIDEAILFNREEGAIGILGILGSDPVEAVDVMEGLPEGEECLRLFAMTDHDLGWIAFTITSEDIHVKHFKGDLHLDFYTGGPRMLIYENPALLPIRIKDPLALSATHLIRSMGNRKPFKRTVLSIPAEYKIPGTFIDRSLPSEISGGDIMEVLPDVHTLLFQGAIYKAGTIPTRPGQVPEPFLAMGLDHGRTLSLVKLSERLSNVSLAILPGASKKDAYTLGHLFSLFGVPTVLIPGSQGSESDFVEPFLEKYAISSVEKARRATGLDHWVQLGFRGMSSEEARLFARKRFSQYVRNGMKAYRTNRPRQALALFENALNVAAEIKALKRYQADLHRSARESAYAADLIEKAIFHANALVDNLSARVPDSKAHAEALLKLGLLKARAEQYGKALPALEEAVKIMSNLELGPEQVAALSDLGVVLENATEYDRAMVQFKSAASLSKKLNKKELLARQYMRIGRLHDLRLSRYARALKSYQAAFGIYTELGRKGKMAQSLLDMGRCYRLLGNFREANDHYLRALGMLEGAGEWSRLRAKIIMEQANNAWFQAQYQEAFNLQREI